MHLEERAFPYWGLVINDMDLVKSFVFKRTIMSYLFIYLL